MLSVLSLASHHTYHTDHVNHPIDAHVHTNITYTCDLVRPYYETLLLPLHLSLSLILFPTESPITILGPIHKDNNLIWFRLNYPCPLFKLDVRSTTTMMIHKAFSVPHLWALHSPVWLLALLGVSCYCTHLGAVRLNFSVHTWCSTELSYLARGDLKVLLNTANFCLIPDGLVFKSVLTQTHHESRFLAFHSWT